jgi:hypothetical protein
MAKQKTQVETADKVPPSPIPDQEVGSEEKQGSPESMPMESIRQTNTIHRMPTATEMQQTVGNTRAGQMIQRQPRGGSSSVPTVGTRFTHPKGSKSPHKSITGEFDGKDFVLKGDGSVLMSVPAGSGRPVSVRASDAKACGGSTSESYFNNPRYVGIRDYGPIPEGEYRFRAEDFATFTAAEQAQFTLGGNFKDPFGAAMHGGDWGAGRAALNKVRVLPAPKGCGNTSRRSGFYIHGGSLPGSSGCIDIDNTGIASLLTHITGFRGQITVTVRYRHAAPSVGTLQRVLGGATYPGQENPSVMDRLGGAVRELTGGSDED